MRRAFICPALLFAIAATPGAAGADKPDKAKSSSSMSPEEFIKALTAKPKGPPEVDGRIARSSMPIGPEIPFDTNSAALNGAALAALQTIGRTLKEERFANATFLVAGHTDASGGKNYNLELSERRADAVRRFLVGSYGLSAIDLIAAGYGKERLKDAAHPTAAENRRVEIFAVDMKLPRPEPVENGGIPKGLRVW